MNERIKKLMLDAGYAAPEIAPRAQKLADLIVKECANVSETHKGMNDKYFIADAIKKHFGVE